MGINTIITHILCVPIVYHTILHWYNIKYYRSQVLMLYKLRYIWKTKRIHHFFLWKISCPINMTLVPSSSEVQNFKKWNMCINSTNLCILLKVLSNIIVIDNDTSKHNLALYLCKTMAWHYIGLLGIFVVLFDS